MHRCPNLLIENEDSTNVNTIILLEKNWERFNQKEIKRWILKTANKRLIAICTTNIYDDLKTFALENNIDILKFSGYFDIRYFIHLFDHFQKNKLKQNEIGMFDAINLSFDRKLYIDGEKILLERANNSKVTSLITSAFDPNNFHAYNDLLNPLASQAISNLFEEHNGKRFVNPITMPDNLSHYLEMVSSNLIVWTHFGHGSQVGLQSFGEFSFTDTKKWLEIFQGLGITMRLAFFFSCESAKIAERFRDIGAKITVGFGKKPLMKDCLALGKIIVPLALSGNNDEEIIQLFEERCKVLGKDYCERCDPQIFVST